jgi:tetratricopeptide (TPR) repeat protein/predicted Ser/Thr protein kinase
LKPERWERIKKLFQSALEQDPVRRAEFLQKACAGDESLRAEVEAMLARHAESPDFLESPAIQAEAQALAQDLEAEMVGKMLGPYEILAPIGAGGMGKVYKARDTRLDRLVAIKISKEEFSERFEQEARAVAALNHPHICTLYDVGPNYLVMEYIEGNPLTGPLPTKKVFEFGAQILDALEAAHEKKIIHRDLKPPNILVTKQGIKLLDFGLAKMELQPAQSPLSSDETETMPLTQAGAVMGTPAYMAPEQWEGKPADARSDIYAFGCVLYEMLTGKRIVQERTAVQPKAIENILRRCLAKDAEQRWQSAGELKSRLASVSLRRKRSRFGLAAATLAALATVVLFWPRTNAAPLTDKDVLVLAEFTNGTEDPVFDVTLRAALAAQLEESPFLKILGDEEVREHLRMMNHPPDERITNQLAREICLREENKATIGGSIAKLGKNYEISIEAINCRTGETLARQQVEAEDKEHVIRALGAAATKMRARLGESLSSIEKLNSLPGDVTTSSLEALQAFALARKKNQTEGHLAAIPFAKRATEIDPNFASAWEQLGNAYFYGAGDQQRQIECMKKAFALVDHVSERERLRISALYYTYVTLEYEKAADIWQLLMHTYPRWGASHNSLGLYYINVAGELEKALYEFQEALRLEPRSEYYSNVISVYLVLGQVNEAKAVAEMWKKNLPHTLEVPGYHNILRVIAHSEGDGGAVETQNRWFAGKPQEYTTLSFQAGAARSLGRFRQADELTLLAVDLVSSKNLIDATTALLLDKARSDARIGRCTEALKYVQQVPTPTMPVLRNQNISLTLAFCGEAQKAEQLLRQVQQQYPNSSYWRTHALPLIRAAAALNRRQPAEAMEQLRLVTADTRYEVIRMRALAYLGMGKGQEAAAEFQKLLDRNYRDALAKVGLARSLALMGDVAKAKTAYEDFLDYWKDADRDAPLLIAARQEYSALR